VASRLYKGEALAKTPFCNNPECDLHQYPVTPDVMRLEVKKPGVIIGTMSKKPFMRTLFTSEDKKRRAFFCEVCVSAIDTAHRAVGEVEKPKTITGFEDLGLVGLNYISVYTLSDGATHEIPTGFDDNANPAIRLKSDADQLMALGVSEGEVGRFFTQRMVEATSKMREEVRAEVCEWVMKPEKNPRLTTFIWKGECGQVGRFSASGPKGLCVCGRQVKINKTPETAAIEKAVCSCKACGNEGTVEPFTLCEACGDDDMEPVEF
jgi:hypothetical protein